MYLIKFEIDSDCTWFDLSVIQEILDSYYDLLDSRLFLVLDFVYTIQKVLQLIQD